MRFRLPEWDIEMPRALVNYWTAWNMLDLDAVPALLAQAVTTDVEWNDPRDSFVGIGELEAAMRRLRTAKPDYRFDLASEIDHHHGRCRYRWTMKRRHRILMEGLDIVTLDEVSGLVCRVDGFFGEPTPIGNSRSGVPGALRGGDSTPAS